MKASTAQRIAWLIGGSVAALPGMAMARQQQASFHSSFEPGDPAPRLMPTAGRFSATIDGGPGRQVVLTAKPGVGFSGLRSLHYRARGAGRQQVRLFKLDLPVLADTQLSYVIFPQRVPGDLRNPANYVALDLLFDDGSRLSTRGALDQHRIGASAQAQGTGRVLYPDQWNFVSIDLGRVAAGRRIRQIMLDHDGPAAAAFEGYLDDLRIEAEPADPRRRPSDFVDTRRGSNANGNFSRGNTYPALALPHGFNFWTPVTDASGNWLCQYQDHNGADNRPRLQAFALSHEPSPWMGDRQTFQLMPEAQADGMPLLDRAARSLGFSHAHEDAHAHDYRVAFDNGIVTEITPTDHAAMFRFSFPGAHAQLLFDNINDHGGITLDAAGRSFSGWSAVKSRLSAGATRLFFYGTVDQPVQRSGRLAGAGRDHVAAWFAFDTAKIKV
ncbi:MAG TPA: glycoside hydrolase family 92 protein, partial [Rhodanobacter sp.]